MRKRALTFLAAPIVAIALTASARPALAQTDDPLQPLRTSSQRITWAQLQQILQVLADYGQQVGAIAEDLGQDTQDLVVAIDATLTPEQRAYLQTLPAVLEDAVEQARARVAALPPEQRTFDAIAQIVAEELGAAIDGFLLGFPALSPQQQLNILAALNDYQRDVAQALDNLNAATEAAKAAIAAILGQ